jgi:hypothetical protein
MTNPDRAFPVVIVQDRYNGLYSGGDWFAIAESDTPYLEADLEPTRIAYCLESGPNGPDEEARTFWRHRPYWIASGSTPQEAIDALLQNA